jgi:hypothetical protein
MHCTTAQQWNHEQRFAGVISCRPRLFVIYVYRFIVPLIIPCFILLYRSVSTGFIWLTQIPISRKSQHTLAGCIDVERFTSVASPWSGIWRHMSENIYSLLYEVRDKLTPWSWVLLEKPPVAQLLKKFQTFCVTQSQSSPCGGGIEYLHRDPASRRRQRKGKSQIWDSKIW